jgi:hypothetical protein
MIRAYRRRLRQVFDTLSCVAIVGMIAVSLSIMDVGTKRDLARLSWFFGPVESVSGQNTQIQPPKLVALIEWVGVGCWLI